MDDLSIHPRHWRETPGFGDGKKHVTTKPRKGPAKKLDKKLAWLNVRQRDCEFTRKSNKNAAAYKMPGSMND